METLMPFSAVSTFPPPINRSGLSPEELHILTAIPRDLLEGYAAGHYKPAETERLVLTELGRVIYKMTPLVLALYMDKIRFRVLRRIITKSAVDKLLALRNYEDYHTALLNLMELHEDEVEQVIAKSAKANGYDPTQREANPAD